MKFEYVHEFDMPVEELERLMTHPEISRLMSERMSSIIGTETQERQEQGNAVERKVLYKPEPLIKKVGPLVVEPRWMEWVETSRYDFDRHEGTFTNRPMIGRIAEKMDNEGRMRILPNGAGCKRVLTGTLKVKVFMLGKIAEKIIEKTARKIIDEEAALLQTLAREEAL